MWTLSKAAECLENALANAKSRDNIIFLTIKLSRFKSKVEGDYNAAIELVQKILKKYPINEKLHLHLVDLEYSRPAVNVVSACKCCDNVIDNNQMPLKTKLKFAQRKIEFLEDFGNDAQMLTDARRQFEALLVNEKDLGHKQHGKPEDHLHDSVSTPPPEKRSRYDSHSPSATESPASSYPTTQAGSAGSSSYYYPWSYYTAGQTQPVAYTTSSAASYQQYAQQYWAAAANTSGYPATTTAPPASAPR
jgi:pre-mRNA-processing factor 39